MTFFAKKPDPEPQPSAERAVPVVATPRYGIADAIQLMRTLPSDQNGDLIIRVVRATLTSLKVRLPDIIEDASRKQKITQERIAAVHAQIATLEKKLGEHKGEITTLEADLKETTAVKERLETAERSADEDTGAHQASGQPGIAMRV